MTGRWLKKSPGMASPNYCSFCVCQGLNNLLLFQGEGKVITSFLWEAEVSWAAIRSAMGMKGKLSLVILPGIQSPEPGSGFRNITLWSQTYLTFLTASLSVFSALLSLFFTLDLSLNVFASTSWYLLLSWTRGLHDFLNFSLFLGVQLYFIAVTKKKRLLTRWVITISHGSKFNPAIWWAEEKWVCVTSWLNHWHSCHKIALSLVLSYRMWLIPSAATRCHATWGAAFWMKWCIETPSPGGW